MQVGRRIARLRASHGESLREAAIRTGVSHTTIARIEKGEVTGSFHSTLRKIADGYGVRVEFLLTGRDPRQDVEAAIRRLSADDRYRLYFVSVRTRVKMVLDFLLSEYPEAFSVEQLARTIGMEPSALEETLNRWTSRPLPEDVCERLAQTLAQITGIASQWFLTGAAGGDLADLVPREWLYAYVNLMRKAAQAGIHPQTLEMAVDLLTMRNKQSPAHTSA